MQRAVIALVCLVMIGVATLVVVRIAEYDGRSPMERFEDEAAGEKPEPVSLTSCPSQTPRVESLPDRNRRQPDEVIPDAAVGVLLCQYRGFGTDTPISYERQETLARDGAIAGSIPWIVGEIQRSERRSDSQLETCPESDGSRLLAIFRYRREPSVPVIVDLSGCRFAAAPGRPMIVLSKRLLYRLEHSFSETVASQLPPESG